MKRILIFFIVMLFLAACNRHSTSEKPLRVEEPEIADLLNDFLNLMRKKQNAEAFKLLFDTNDGFDSSSKEVLLYPTVFKK